MSAIKKFIPALIMTMPLLAAAQGLEGVIETFGRLVDLALPVVIGIAILIFAWGLISYVAAGGDEEKRKGARQTMIYGVIIIFVMVSIWGLVRILQQTFPGVESPTAPPAPELPQ